MPGGPLSFSRRDEHRAVGGVAGGFADQHGIDAVVVRGALVVLSFAGGLGIVLYALGALFADPPGTPLPPPHPRDQRRNLAVASIALGAALVVRSTGLWLGDALMVPMIAMVSGLVVLGVVRPAAGERPWQALPATQLGDLTAGRHARIRLITGAALVAVGLVMVGTRGGVSPSVRVGSFATAVTILGVAVLLGPWLARLAQQAAAERRERIRANEREAMAAHLHDSVLQTLALIQRTADDPRRTVTLARQQERELREWLYGRRSSGGESLATAVRAMADEVEALHDVRVEVVVVGDVGGRATGDTAGDAAGDPAGDPGRLVTADRVDALVGAMREACVNAAKHSGVDEVSVYVEVVAGEPGGTCSVEAFVRDRGRGFDRDAAADPVRDPTRHRAGITQSIEARLERVGGRATIESAPGSGTEVHLVVPITAPGHSPSAAGPSPGASPSPSAGASPSRPGSNQVSP